MNKYELNADTFALFKMSKYFDSIEIANLNNSLAYFLNMQWKIFPEALILMERQQQFNIYYMYRVKKCWYKTNGVTFFDSLDKNCSKMLDKFATTYWFIDKYKKVIDPDNLKKLTDSAINDTIVDNIALIGNYWLRSVYIDTSLISKAYSLFSCGCYININSSNLYGTKSKELLIEGREEFCFLSGKICELKFDDKLKAIHFYKIAEQSSRYMSKSYYANLIKRLEKIE